MTTRLLPLAILLALSILATATPRHAQAQRGNFLEQLQRTRIAQIGFTSVYTEFSYASSSESTTETSLKDDFSISFEEEGPRIVWSGNAFTYENFKEDNECASTETVQGEMSSDGLNIIRISASWQKNCRDWRSSQFSIDLQGPIPLASTGYCAKYATKDIDASLGFYQKIPHYDMGSVTDYTEVKLLSMKTIEDSQAYVTFCGNNPLSPPSVAATPTASPTATAISGSTPPCKRECSSPFEEDCCVCVGGDCREVGSNQASDTLDEPAVTETPVADDEIGAMPPDTPAENDESSTLPPDAPVEDDEIGALPPDAPVEDDESSTSPLDTPDLPEVEIPEEVGLPDIPFPPLIPSTGIIPGPETLPQALSGIAAPAVLIAILAGLGQALGGIPPASGAVPGGSTPTPDAPSPPNGQTEFTLTDVAGRTYTYVWDPDRAGYINPLTGGMFDPTLWAEYNRNLPGNLEFIAKQREAMSRPTPLHRPAAPDASEFQKVMETAERMINRLPADDPSRQDLERIVQQTRSQGIGQANLEQVKQSIRQAWERYREQQMNVYREWMDLDRKLGYLETGLHVAKTIGRIAGTTAERMLGGSGLVTGFVYGAAENWDKGAGRMVGNGLINSAFAWTYHRLEPLRGGDLLKNAGIGAFFGAAESAVQDWFNTGQVNTNNVAWGAAFGAAGSAFEVKMKQWMQGTPASAPAHAAQPGPASAPIGRSGAPLSGEVPLSQQPQTVRRMFSNVEFGPDCKPYARLEDVLTIQRSPTDVRTLKNAPPGVREAFNNTLRQKVYEPHDRKLVEWVKANVPEARGRPVRVEDFRTPAIKSDLTTINTDRDYRVVVQTERGWIEVPKEKWQHKSYEIFGELTDLDETAVRQAHPEIDWERMTPEQRAMKQRELWARDHQQLATDRASIEASPDYSDQAVVGGHWQQVESNILKVKRGQGVLKDADALGQMYYEKVHAALRQNNLPEAVAQAQKAIHSLWDVRKGYAMQNIDVGRLPGNLQRALHIIREMPVDNRATPEVIAAMNQRLAQVGFPGGVDQVMRAVSAQFAALKLAGGAL